MTITDYRNDPRFKNSKHAFLVTGTPENDLFNRNLLSQSQTGYWVVGQGRIHEGNVIFILLPNIDKRSGGYPRDLYAGVITQYERRTSDDRVLFTVKQFHKLNPIDANLRAFLGNRLPLAGNRALTVW